MDPFDIPHSRSLAVDVALVPGFLPETAPDRFGTVYIVVDVIRATTTLCVLFERGCRRVLVAPGIEAARRARATAVPDALLAGEAGGLAPAGFDFGNSPRELASAAVAGRDVIFATTNGTRALRACMGGRTILAGAFRNAGAVTTRALTIALATPARPSRTPATSHGRTTFGASEADLGQRQPDIVIVCSGRNDRPAFDDTLCAGYLVRRLATRAADKGVELTLREGARIARVCAQSISAHDTVREALAVADAARAIERIGLGGDLLWCADVDATTIVPAVSDTEDADDLIVITADGDASGG